MTQYCDSTTCTWQRSVPVISCNYSSLGSPANVIINATLPELQRAPVPILPPDNCQAVLIGHVNFAFRHQEPCRNVVRGSMSAPPAGANSNPP